ncbi:unnamed protein product, partial [Prorocentrum cordatum]
MADFEYLDTCRMQLSMTPAKYVDKPAPREFRNNRLVSTDDLRLTTVVYHIEPDCEEPIETIEHGVWASLAARGGRRGIFKKPTPKRTEKLAKECAVIFGIPRVDVTTVARVMCADARLGQRARGLVDYEGGLISEPTEFYLRGDRVEVRAEEGVGSMGRFAAIYNDQGQSADLEAARKGRDPFHMPPEAVRVDSDVSNVIYADEPEVRASRPAIRQTADACTIEARIGDQDAGAAHQCLKSDGDVWAGARQHHSSTMVSTAEATPRLEPSVGTCGDETIQDARCNGRGARRSGQAKVPNVLGAHLTTARSAHVMLSVEFNVNVLLGESEVVLSDDTGLMAMIITDGAASFWAVAPTSVARSVAGVEALKCFVRGWLSSLPILGQSVQEMTLRLVDGPRRDGVRGGLAHAYFWHADEDGAARKNLSHDDPATGQTLQVEITFQSSDLTNAVAVAIGGSSFANAGRDKTASDASPNCLIAENEDDKVVRGEPAKEVVGWHGLGVTQKRRNNLELIANLKTLHAPTKEVLASWRDDSMRRHTLISGSDQRLAMNSPSAEDLERQVLALQVEHAAAENDVDDCYEADVMEHGVNSVFLRVKAAAPIQKQFHRQTKHVKYRILDKLAIMRKEKKPIKAHSDHAQLPDRTPTPESEQEPMSPECGMIADGSFNVSGCGMPWMPVHPGCNVQQPQPGQAVAKAFPPHVSQMSEGCGYAVPVHHQQPMDMWQSVYQQPPPPYQQQQPPPAAALGGAGEQPGLLPVPGLTAEQLQALEQDPELAAVFQDIKRNGPVAALRAFQDEELMMKISKKIQTTNSEAKQPGKPSAFQQGDMPQSDDAKAG